MRILYTLICTCLLIFSTCNMAHAVLIHVQWGAALPLTTQQQAQDTTVQDLIYTEALQFIGTPLPTARAKTLKTYLNAQARGLTSSVSELETTPYPDGTNNTIFDITINTNAVHQLLRELGIIYTSHVQLPYTLTIETGESKPDTKSIASLEILTGLVRQVGSPLQLHLLYEAPLWHASITHDLDIIRAEAPTIDSVWRRVWESYLAKQQQINAQTAKLYTLRVWGWENAAAIENLHQALNTWDASVQSPILETIGIQAGSTSATWQIHIMHLADLTQRLKQYTIQNKLTFLLREELSPPPTPTTPTTPPMFTPPTPAKLTPAKPTPAKPMTQPTPTPAKATTPKPPTLSTP